MKRTVPGEGPATDVRIVLLFPVLDFGGIESRAVIQARGMAARYPRLRFCCFADEGWAAGEIRALGVPVDVLEASPSVRNPRATWRLWRYLSRWRPDVLHASSGAMTVHGLLAGTAAGVPVRIVEEVGIPSRGRVGRWLFPFLYRLATCVIGVSDAVVVHLINQDGVPPAKARRIYNAIEDRFLELRDHAPSPDTFRIFAAGRLAPVKGHADLLQALAPLLRGEDMVTLQIAGDGSELRALHRLASELRIAERVTFCGHRTDVPELLAACDLFVLPSRSEGFGLAVVEAMAVGVPIIATSVGGVPEVVPSWAQEWLVPPGDVEKLRAAVRRMVAIAPDDRAMMGQRLREHAVAHFDPQQYVANLEALYAELLAEARRR
jgi:glycosyltransferase involved in cell wall biosynthesis